MLKDKVVVITGAGTGLGSALSKAFVSEGATVIGFGRSKQTLEQTKRSINHDLFSYAEADVSDFASVKTAVAAIVEQHGKIDFLFNNAAVYPRDSFIDETADAFAKALSINVTGVANCCKAVLPIMIKHKFGRIFNLGSWAYLGPIPNSAVYSTSKAAVHTLTKSIAADLEAIDADIQIHEWIPGQLNTQMGLQSGLDPAVPAAWAVSHAQSVAHAKNCIFDQGQEWQAPKSLKQKIKSKLLFGKA